MATTLYCWQIASLRSLPRCSGPWAAAHPLVRQLAPANARRRQSQVAAMAAAPGSKAGLTANLLETPNETVAKDMLDFINASVTQFHAVEEASKMLQRVGFQQLSETAEWQLRAGGRYFFTRNLSTLVAFAVGADYKPGSGFHMVGAHTDSPCLKLKPVSKGTKAGYLMANVEPYGGGLWHTWFDRDLTVAGRVILRQPDGRLAHRLVRVPRPILRVPMLAIHLYREIYESGFKPNKQDHLTPVLATALKAEVNASTKAAGKGAAPEAHHPLLLQLLAAELGCAPEAIVDFELNVCDTQPGVIGGAKQEFVWVGRLDNLAMSYTATRALADAFPDEASLAGQDSVKAVALFDHEEVGSASAEGAASP